MKKYRYSLVFLITALAVWLVACDAAPQPQAEVGPPKPAPVATVEMLDSKGLNNRIWSSQNPVQVSGAFAYFIDCDTGKETVVSGNIVVTYK